MNIQTSGGIIFNADKDAAGTGTNAFYGYLAFIANDAAKGALGGGDTKGDWKGNINVGAPANCNLGTNAHIKVTVKGGMIHVEITNKDSGKPIYDYTYKIGSSDKDANWVEGTVGLRMRAEYAANFAVSAGNAYFDNLKITTAKEAVIGEAALHRSVGSPDIMAAQTAHLLELDRRENVELSVLPWAAGEHSAMRGGAFPSWSSPTRTTPTSTAGTP